MDIKCPKTLPHTAKHKNKWQSNQNYQKIYIILKWHQNTKQQNNPTVFYLLSKQLPSYSSNSMYIKLKWTTNVLKFITIRSLKKNQKGSPKGLGPAKNAITQIKLCKALKWS